MSQIQICNRALTTYLGEGRISSLDEGSPAAEQCSIHYDDTVEALLSLYDWRFARGFQTLALLENDRVGVWLYRYARPTEALHISWVNKDADARFMIAHGDTPDTDRELVGDSIYSDTQFASCQFIKSVTDTERFPQYFKDAISAMLAASISMPLTQNVKIAERAEQRAEQRIDQAITRAEQEEYISGKHALPEHLKLRGIR